MKKLIIGCTILGLIATIGCNGPVKEEKFSLSDIEKYYKAAHQGIETRWISSKNKQGEKGKGGMTNKGAKGDAFSMIGPGDTLVIFDQKGPAIITKMWVANSFGWTRENRRKVS